MLKLLISIFLWMGLLSHTFANPHPIAVDILTEDYPPYNFVDDNKTLTGLSVDLLEAMLQEMHIPKNRENFLVVPWARGYAEVRNPKRTNILFSMTRTKEREHLFKWVGPITETTIVILAPKTHSIVIKKPEDLRQYQFGVIRGDIGELLLKQQGVSSENIQTSSNFQSILKKMALNRIDLLAYEKNVAFWLMKKYGFNPADYQEVFTLQKSQLYYAFNLSIDDGTVHLFQKTLDNIKTSPVGKAIQAKYFK